MHRAKCRVHKMATPLGMFRGSNLNSSWGKYDVWLVNQWVPLSFCVFLCMSVHSKLRVLMWQFSKLDFYIHLGHWHADDIDWFIWLSSHIDYIIAMIILLTLTCMFTLLYILFVLVLTLLLVYYHDYHGACYPCYTFISFIILFVWLVCRFGWYIHVLHDCFVHDCSFSVWLHALLLYVGHISIPLFLTL